MSLRVKLLMGSSNQGSRDWWQASAGDIFGQICLSMPHKSGCLDSLLISLRAVPASRTHAIQLHPTVGSSEEKGEQEMTLETGSLGDCLQSMDPRYKQSVYTDSTLPVLLPGGEK